MDVKCTVMTAEDIMRALNRIRYEILEKNPGGNLAIIGIHTRGVLLAKKICEKITEAGENVQYGVLDVTRFRDDMPAIKGDGKDHTDIKFSLNEKNLIIVDDVLFTGRTVRSALNAIMALGRPNKIQLAVLIDRGHRELPIKADFVGKNVPTARTEEVKVNLIETDGFDSVQILGE